MKGIDGRTDYIKTTDRDPRNISLRDFRGDPFTASQSELADYVKRKSR